MRDICILAAICTLVLPTIARSESFYCSRVVHESLITSTGKLGVLRPTPADEAPRYTEVEPGDCFYDEAIRDMREMCAILSELPEGRQPPGAEEPSFEGPFEIDSPSDSDEPDSLESVQKLKASVAKLKKRVRTLRRKLHSKGSY